MATVTITPTDNGPLMIEGPASVVDADGNPYDLSGQTTIFLCRCGGSATKPFCDGTHEGLSFEAAQRAVSGSDAEPGHGGVDRSAEGLARLA